MNKDKQTELNAIGAGAYAAIKEMVAALQCDYDRLEELRDDRACANHESMNSWSMHPDAEELTDLESAAGDCKSQDDARQRIEEDALEITVRSGWQSLGETLEPAEYCILLTTGGPAVRIIGELDRGQPTSATLQVQDWFTPWTDYTGNWNPAANKGFGGNSVDEDVLLAYASVFYFGEG